MPDEGVNLPFEIARQVVVVEQNAVLQGLMPTLDLSLGLWMIWGRRVPSKLAGLPMEVVTGLDKLPLYYQKNDPRAKSQ